MAKRKPTRKASRSIEGFEYRDKNGPFAGVDDIRQGLVMVYGSQTKDSDGKISSPYRARDVLDILLSNNRIGKVGHDAGRRFDEDFGIANLVGVRAVNYFRVEGSYGSVPGMTKAIIMARDRVMAAIKYLGGSGSASAEAAWHVLGLGMDIKDFAAATQIGNGRSIHPQFATGLVVGVCGSLAVHYKMLVDELT